MRKLNEKAWHILNGDEQLALNLQLGLDKSTWEAGEVMKRAHYKYLEISQRAQHFLKVFTEYFTLYDDFPPEVVEKSLGRELAYFFVQTVVFRSKVKDAMAWLDKEFGYTMKNRRFEDITKWFIKHADSEDLEILNFVNLVKEFDRWNNFRILPKELQEPSAYKRRNKNLHRKHIKVLHSLPDLNLDLMRKICSSKRATGIYACIIPKGQAPLVFHVKPTQQATLTKVFIYTWKSKEEAQAYGDTVFEYVSPDKRHCKHGLDFWPKYRDIIKSATNYAEVHRMAPSRRYLIMALSKLEFFNH